MVMMVMLLTMVKTNEVRGVWRVLIMVMMAMMLMMMVGMMMEISIGFESDSSDMVSK